MRSIEKCSPLFVGHVGRTMCNHTALSLMSAHCPGGPGELLPFEEVLEAVVAFGKAYLLLNREVHFNLNVLVQT